MDKYKKLNTMKYTILLLITLSIALGGCSDEWLNDVEPQGKLLEVNYYQSQDEMEKGLISIYNVFKNQYWQGVWSSWYMLSSLPSDDALAVGGGRADRPEFWEAYDYATTPISSGLVQVWNRPYYGIYRANVIIDRVDPNGGDINKVMIAEAKMLRAYFYFELVRYFGEVPLIDHVLTPAEFDQAKVSKEEIFELIVQDLKDASVYLPKRWTGANAYRMTKYAAHGLLGKTYMYMASPFFNIQGADYYELAKTELKKVIDEGDYTLEPDYNMIWWYGNEFNNETLIEMSYGYTESDGWGNGGDITSNVIQQLQGPRGINSNDTLSAGWGFDMVTQNLVDEYRTQGDSVRLHGTALAEWQMREWGINSFDVQEDYSGFYSNKRATWKLLNPGSAPWGWSNNERILRLADIYLLYAEALNQTGDDATARTYVDIVRTRSNLGSITEVESSQSLDLFAAIKLERRLELAQEGQRFFDLIRWNDAETVLGSAGYTEKNAHYPIPQEEIDNSNGVLIQNPLY